VRLLPSEAASKPTSAFMTAGRRPCRLLVVWLIVVVCFALTGQQVGALCSGRPPDGGELHRSDLQARLGTRSA
jgi:hypothetical protein